MVDVVGYEGYYKITTNGEVFSVKRGKYLSLNQKKNGYVYVELNKMGVAKTLRVHRLVAQAYIPNDDMSLEVNHKNGIKNDNRLENLEWVTRSYNTKHAYDNGLITDIFQGYKLTMNSEFVIVYGLDNLVDITGYTKSTLATYVNNKQPLIRGKFKNYCISKV